jgi:membrane dipeptidase
MIFDAHLDLALNGVDWNRDLRCDVRDLRAQETSLAMTEPGRQNATVTFPELRKAGVALGVATLLARQEQPINHPFGWTTPEACYAIAHAHLNYYRALERSGWMTPIRTREQLQAHVAKAKEKPQAGPFGYILSMECADAVLDPNNIYEWYDAGLRAIGITHYGANRYGGGTRSEVGLAADAIPLLKNIQKLGMALDMTHLSDVAFWQVGNIFDGRVLASHQNARKLCNWQRQFSDEQLKFVIERRGVIGVALDAIMLQPGYVRGQSRREVTLQSVVANIDHVCQLAGNSLHSGIGSDLDGGFGCEQTPSDVDTIFDLTRLPELLRQRGYKPDDIENVLWRNWVNFFAEVLPGRES